MASSPALGSTNLLMSAAAMGITGGAGLEPTQLRLLRALLTVGTPSFLATGTSGLPSAAAAATPEPPDEERPTPELERRAAGEQAQQQRRRSVFA